MECKGKSFPGPTLAMLPSIPHLLLILLLASPALLTPSEELQLRSQRTPRDAKQDSIKVVISEGCATPGDSPDGSQGGKEIDLAPGSPLVLTHKIKLVPSDSASGSGSCGCDADFAPLRERLERLEREVSALRETCAGTEESCCTSKESKGAGCSIKPETSKCPNECSDQGRCVDGKCVCFSGFTGPDCSQSNCPGNCSNSGKCVNGQCVCDPGFIGPDCSQRACPNDCNNRGRCVNGKCVCDSGFTGPSCLDESCARNCNRRGRCVDGQCVCNPGFTGPDCSQRACPDNCNNQGRCVNGKCVCDSGFTGPSCLNKSCSGNCNRRGRCVDGQCVCNPGFTGPDCSQRACPSDCNNQGSCVNGRCVCDSGFTGPSCSDESCPGNCNRRGRCVKGQCVCNPGFTGPDCSKKACPDNCNNQGRCVNGKCVCNSGFTGADCSEAACPGNCNNRGRCVNGQCLCDNGFAGEDCTERACPNDCTDHGRCVSGNCICDSGFIGNDCSEKACPENCNNRGRCVNGQCVCNDGFTGADCSEKACPDNCNNRGRCLNGQCVCNDGFTGADCSEKACPNNCNNRGRCVNGQCVCNDGFTGADCSEKACPDNCNNRGRCLNGQCVCNDGFTGADCSEKACPDNCNNRGRCVNGQCVCNDGFTGADCSEKACPNNCNNRGRCVNGQCVCNDGFTGAHCSEKACPNNCGNHGKCINGKCSCDVGFMGPDCSAKICPNNCNSRGRCVRGSCVCRRGFKGPDCSQCQERMTGPNCDVVMSGVSQLSTQNITETSVAVVWTPPPVQYETYHITFTSQKETDQQITMQVDGRLTTFTQTGLAAGQDYRVSIVGEIDGRRGAESTAEFTTLISGPTNLQVVKMSSTSAVVQWEPSVGEIDRYRLTVTPYDGAESQEMTIPADQNSAHIQQLEAGHLYEIQLVAEKGMSRSTPETIQAVPGPEPPSNIVFSKVTENSVTVSWTKPKSSVSGFKVTYTHADDGEPVSVSLDSKDSTVSLSELSPGSSYEVTIISTLGLDESDPVKDFVMTLPDPPTHLRAVNVTESSALLLWRPALAAVDKYSIVYGEGTGSEVRVTVSGNSAEQQLTGLEESTTYTVTVTSQLGSRDSSPATTTFTTAGGSGRVGEGLKDLRASDVTPRTAMLSWKPPSKPVSNYRLSFQAEGQEMKEVIVDASLTQYNLTRLHPGSTYTVQLLAEGEGHYTSPSSTEFTTGTLRYPFPTDCSQELLNGIRTSGNTEIFPQGRHWLPVMVYCDMETDGGGWTVFQRRKDGSVNFFRGWKEYTKGFGDPNGEFWLGLESIHNLTAMTRMSLRVDLRNGEDSAFAQYSTFEVAKKNYKLTVGGYSGTAGDSLTYHNNRIFSTKDRDLASFITRCAMSYRGGWWYKNCHEANLNGLYGINIKHQGVIWTAWKGKDFSIPFTEMKMRPAAFRPPSRA
ncbi:tenascin-like [Archocentrus centrarchus]|uniref:tenascin-like n=1 Tax=Archocentrus centrarchus TaxID=63155 RepID=UPI0011EA2BA9|nr:tenascin-like [Archocentrus centrarchus]